MPRNIYGETFSDKPPEPSVEVYSLLMRFVQGEKDLYEVLRDVYERLEYKERPLIDELSRLVDSSVISYEDRLFMVVLFAASPVFDYDFGPIRSALVSRSYELIKPNTSLPEPLQGYLLGVLSKIQVGKKY